jgi:hypothetical protein
MASSKFSFAALGAADPIRNAFRTIAGAGANNAMARAQGGLMGAQTAEAAEKARALTMTNDSRANPFALLDDPQVAEYAKNNPSYANALRVGLGLFGATGEGDVAGMLSKIQGSDLTGQGVVAGDRGDVSTQNRLVSAASGKTYEPFKAVGDTGYSIDAGTGTINEANPALAALFGEESASVVAKNRRENNASSTTYDPVSQMLIDKNSGTARPVTVQGGEPGQLFGKRAQDAKAEQIAVDAATSDLDRLASATNAVLNHPGLDRITGLVGVLPNRPGGDAANAQALMETLRSQIGFSVLQAMRAASKTGGALGAVSDKENEMLQNNLAALSTSQSPEQMRASLQNILQYVENNKQRINDAYAAMYGPVNPQGGAGGQPAQQTQLPAPQRVPVRRAVYNGRVIIQYDDGSVEYE